MARLRIEPVAFWTYASDLKNMVYSHALVRPADKTDKGRAMTLDETGERGAPKRRPRFWLWVAAIVAVFAFLFYQSVNYIGLMYGFAEWQFEHFDRYFPVLSIIAILVLLYLLWELVRYVLRRGWRKPPEDLLHQRRIAARRSAGRFLHCVAAVGLILTVGTFIQWMQQPPTRGPATPIALASGRSATLVPGPVSVSGMRAIGPIARYSEDFLFMRRTRFLAPIGRGTGPGSPYNLFAEVRGMDPARDVPETIDGVLRNNAMMPEIRVLYRDADFPVADNSAIIFATPSSANRPFLVLIIELVTLSILALLFARHFFRSADEQEKALVETLATQRQAT
jgi:hypothetical protein